MRKYNGSFSVEASYIIPLILFCICIVVELGVTLHQEVQTEVKTQMEKAPLDMVKAMYRREYVKELLGAFYED